jgi:hypothetical protein
MATPLTKAVHRTLKIKGDKYIASMEPQKGDDPPSFTLRKMRSSKIEKSPIHRLLDLTANNDAPVTQQSMSDIYFTAAEVKSKITVSDRDYKEKVAVLEAVDELVSISEFVAQNSSAYSEPDETETSTETP